MKRLSTSTAALLTSLAAASHLGGEPIELPAVRISPSAADADQVVLDIGPARHSGHFQVQRSSDLESWQPLGEIELDQSERIDLVAPRSADSQAFYRLAHRATDADAELPSVESTASPSDQARPDAFDEKRFSSASPAAGENNHLPTLELTYHVIELSDADLERLLERGVLKTISDKDAKARLHKPGDLSASRVRTRVVHYR